MALARAWESLADGTRYSIFGHRPAVVKDDGIGSRGKWVTNRRELARFLRMSHNRQVFSSHRNVWNDLNGWNVLNGLFPFVTSSIVGRAAVNVVAAISHRRALHS